MQLERPQGKESKNIYPSAPLSQWMRDPPGSTDSPALEVRPLLVQAELSLRTRERGQAESHEYWTLEAKGHERMPHLVAQEAHGLLIILPR